MLRLSCLCTLSALEEDNGRDRDLAGCKGRICSPANNNCLRFWIEPQSASKMTGNERASSGDQVSSAFSFSLTFVSASTLGSGQLPPPLPPQSILSSSVGCAKVAPIYAPNRYAIYFTHFRNCLVGCAFRAHPVQRLLRQHHLQCWMASDDNRGREAHNAWSGLHE